MNIDIDISPANVSRWIDTATAYAAATPPRTAANPWDLRRLSPTILFAAPATELRRQADAHFFVKSNGDGSSSLHRG
jgi:hypothetical protein